MNKHTPTPWMPGKFNQLYGSDGQAVICYGLNVAHNMTGDDPVAKANAAHIVRCVNSHDALVHALRAAKVGLVGAAMFVDTHWEIKTIDAALAAAGASE